ncbi:MAG: hypothetical protein KTR29_22135 [Rhodothermaceae bacterium]|nr:hypothetical protein [Rhodothermaceae bacterium]
MLFLAAQIFLWLAIAFAVGAIIGWWYGSSSAIDSMQSSFDFKKSTEGGGGGGSIGVLSDSLMKTQQELKDCQQSLAVAETRLKEMDLRYENTGDQPTAGETPVVEDDFEAHSEHAGDEELALSDLEQDDLTKIHGIGPYIQKKLYEMGISLYKQIAQLTEEDIEEIGKSINYFPSRIIRDNWKESARDLHQQKYGEVVNSQ